jgi:hypothetical protein
LVVHSGRWTDAENKLLRTICRQKGTLDEMCRTQKENEKYAEQSAIKTSS